MKWKEFIFIALIFFLVGFVVGWHPTFSSVKNFIMGGSLAGLVFQLVGMVREIFKEHREESAKRVEHKNEKKRISMLLISEIDDIQNEFKALSNYHNKVYNKYNDILEEDIFPEELKFDSRVFFNMKDTLKVLDIKCQIDLNTYFKRIDTIKEQYETFEMLHGNPPDSVNRFGQIGSPNSNKVYKFLENTEIVYELGEELITNLTNNMDV